MCHLPCQMQQFLRVANCSVTWILYPFGTEQFFFCKAFKCVFCLVEYIHHCIETIVLTLKAVFLCGGAYSKVPVHVKSHVPELDFFLFGYEVGKKMVRKERMCVWMFVFLQEKGIGRLNWFVFPIKGGNWSEKGAVRESARKKNTLNKASFKCV